MRELELTLSPAEYIEQIAYMRIEPYGGDIDDFRAGLAPATYINAHRAEGKAPIGPLDLFPWHCRNDAAPSPEQVSENVIGLFKSLSTPPDAKNG